MALERERVSTVEVGGGGRMSYVAVQLKYNEYVGQVLSHYGVAISCKYFTRTAEQWRVVIDNTNI